METIPFRKGNISYAFQKIKEDIMQDVANLDNITSSDVEGLQDSLLEQYSLPSFDLHEEGIQREHPEINRDIAGTSAIRTVLFVPIQFYLYR